MPADNEIEFGIRDLRYSDCDFTRSRVSNMVTARDCASRSMSASIAATGMVSSGSSDSKRL